MGSIGLWDHFYPDQKVPNFSSIPNFTMILIRLLVSIAYWNQFASVPKRLTLCKYLVAVNLFNLPFAGRLFPKYNRTFWQRHKRTWGTNIEYDLLYRRTHYVQMWIMLITCVRSLWVRVNCSKCICSNLDCSTLFLKKSSARHKNVNCSTKKSMPYMFHVSILSSWWKKWNCSKFRADDKIIETVKYKSSIFFI
jgi:hypothetical protein